jgi:predicted nucleic acid-binding protein
VAKAAFVVSNTTPLINLAGVGLLELLPDLYGAVTVAELGLTEYEAKASLTEPNLRSLAWLTVVAVPIPDDLMALLDAGEAAEPPPEHTEQVCRVRWKPARLTSLGSLVS